MKKTYLMIISTIFGLLFFACGGASKNSGDTEKAAVDDDSFYTTQPVHSGLYDAENYAITGKSEKKGKFDGRIYFSLSPEMSALYVFENGNRTKIDYLVALKQPFEKNDSGVYVSVDTKDIPVTVTPDTTLYYLNFQKNGDNVKIGFSPKPRHTGNALEILERINQQKTKK